jgi:hypothetical protein
VARFLSPEEMYAADLDKRELVQEWLASLGREDQQFSSAMLEAEVKLRCVGDWTPPHDCTFDRTWLPMTRL